MKNKFVNWFSLVLMLSAALVLDSCSSSPPATSPVAGNVSYDIAAGFGGQVMVDTTTVTDTVVSVDAYVRTIGLKLPDGRVTAYNAGPEVANFNQIKVGDRVKATMVDERSIFLKPPGTPESLGGGVVVARVPDGTIPGLRNIDTLDFTAKVTAINYWLHQVTIQLANGQTKTVTVRENVNLADVNIGDMVAVRITEATTLQLEKP
jgi:hypothetical protein